MRFVLFFAVLFGAIASQSLLGQASQQQQPVVAKGLEAKAAAAKEIEWSYRGAKGPRFWGSLDSKFQRCATGRAQSPVNVLTVKKNANLRAPVFGYKASGVVLANTGKWLSAKVEPGSYLNVFEETWELMSVRFKLPSEHRVRGLHFPMEAQLLHKSPKGGALALSVLFVEGQKNAFLAKLIPSIPTLEGKVNVPNVKINWYDFLPADLGYFTYKGGNTVPPCQEGWTWIVMTSYLSADLHQINAMRSYFPAGNDREPQDIGDRVVEEFVAAGTGAPVVPAATSASASASASAAAASAHSSTPASASASASAAAAAHH